MFNELKRRMKLEEHD